MAIEITFRGADPKTAKLAGECNTCGTRLRCLRSDAKDSRDPREPGLYVDCPVCTSMIWLGRAAFD